MSLGIVSKIVLGLTLVIIVTAILIYMKVFVKNLENENDQNKEEMAINGKRWGGGP
jgi:flagellar basal body-associated protein FliL